MVAQYTHIQSQFYPPSESESEVSDSTGISGTSGKSETKQFRILYKYYHRAFGINSEFAQRYRPFWCSEHYSRYALGKVPGTNMAWDWHPDTLQIL
jgi:hypothetical protein